MNENGSEGFCMLMAAICCIGVIAILSFNPGSWAAVIVAALGWLFLLRGMYLS